MVCRFAVAAAIVAVALLSQGCGISIPVGGSAATPRETPAVTNSAVPAFAASPTSPAAPGARPATASAWSSQVTPQLDEGRQVSRAVPTAGATLTATAADGTRFTLELPEGAVPGEQPIRLTPLAALDGLSLSGGLIAGAQIEPDGLALLRPATLTIETRTALNPERVLAFAYAGKGEDFHLYPSVVSGNKITMWLTHFSGHGVGSGSDSDVQAAASASPADPQSKAENDEVVRLREALKRGDKEAQAAVEQAMREVFTTNILPYLQAAQGSQPGDHSFEKAAMMYMGWAMNAQTLLYQGNAYRNLTPEVQQGFDMLDRAYQSLIPKALGQCVSDREPELGAWMWDAHLFMNRFAEELSDKYGWNLPIDAGKYTSEALQPYLGKCWRFKLTFDSQVDIDYGDGKSGWRTKSHVKGDEILEMDGPIEENSNGVADFDGKGKMTVLDASWEWYGESAPLQWICPMTIASGGVADFSLWGSFPAEGDLWNPKLGDMSAAWTLQSPQPPDEVRAESFGSCPGIEVLMQQGFGSLWLEGYSTTHKEEFRRMTETGAEYGVGDLKYVGGKVVFRWAEDRAGDVAGTKVNFALKGQVVHMPEGAADDTTDPSNLNAGNEPDRKPVGPKTVDASVLPPELQSVPGPSGFGVVEGSITRTAPGGAFQSAQASWWGTGTIQQTAGFYRQALAADWIPGDEAVGQSSFTMDFVSKTDSKRTLTLNGKTDGSGIRVLETVQQK